MRLPRPRRPETLVVLVAALVVLVGGAALVAGRVATAPDDRVPAGVTIAGVEVGGLDAGEAERAVLANAPPPGGEVQVVLEGEEGFPVTVPVADLGPVPRARLAVVHAMETPSLWERIRAQVGLEAGRRVPLEYKVTSARAEAIVARVTESIDEPGRPAKVGVGGGKVVVTPAAAGRAVDRLELRRRLGRLAPTVQVPIAVVEPAVSDAEAAAARADALRMVRTKVPVTGAGRRAVIERATLLDALRFPVEGGQIEVSLDPDVIAAAVRPAFEAVLGEPVSAGFAVSGNRVSVTPSSPGRRLDAAAVATRIERRAGGPGAVRVAIEPVAPARTTADAQRMRIRELVGEFTTPYACCPPRVTNIRRAVQIMDGTVIPPGGTFSLNEVLGERTRARGFVPAPQINAGELEDAVGGGVSQVSTTTFNAAFFAGMRIVTHMPHEFWITRYPAGREATVSWGGPEMVFENDWDAGLLVAATATDSGVTVRMYSSKLGRRVATETIGDPVYGTAFTVEYTRKVWAGDELKRDERWSWSYRAPPPE